MIKKNTKNLHTYRNLHPLLIWKLFTNNGNSRKIIIYIQFTLQVHCNFSCVNLARLDTRANSSISLASLPAGSPRAEMSANHGGNSITRAWRPRVPIGGHCQINKMLNKLKSMQKSNTFKASLSSFEEIRMLDVKLN